MVYLSLAEGWVGFSYSQEDLFISGTGLRNLYCPKLIIYYPLHFNSKQLVLAASLV